MYNLQKPTEGSVISVFDCSQDITTSNIHYKTDTRAKKKSKTETKKLLTDVPGLMARSKKRTGRLPNLLRRKCSICFC